MKKAGKLLGVLLALALCLSLFPLAFAADSDFTIDHVLSEYHGPGGDVVIPDGVTVIANEAFKGCETMTSVTIPASVVTIREAAFADCENLTDVYYPGDQETWDSIDIREGNTSLAAAELHCGASSGTDPEDPEDPGKSETPSTSFTDVPDGAWYADAVNWAVSTGLMSGTSETTFNPNGHCTRAEIVTLLYRFDGSPEVSTDNNPFTDVPEFLVAPVLWARERGVANGTGPDTFSPGNTLTRGEIVTLLYRYDGSPSVSADNPFTDVPSYFVDPVLWAVDKGLVNGTGLDTFSPTNTCSRAEIAVIMYRWAAN